MTRPVPDAGVAFLPAIMTPSIQKN
jgi:hypothetical protein